MFSGSLVAIVTPMRPDGALDFEAWARLLDLHLANGTNGVVVGGTTGESATLRDAELRELTVRACTQVRGRIPVIAGAGTSSTATTVERVRLVVAAADRCAADRHARLQPAHAGGAVSAFRGRRRRRPHAGRSSTTFPRGPPSTCSPRRSRVWRRLGQIVGVKEAVPEIARVRELVEASGRDFVVLSGDDASAREAICSRGTRGHLGDRERCTARDVGYGGRGAGGRCRAGPATRCSGSRGCTADCSWRPIRSRSSGRLPSWD